MTGLDDAIQRLRTLAEMCGNDRDLEAVAALDEALPHLIDTRRADRLPRGTSFARRFTPGMGGEEWSWQGRGFRGHSATLTEAIAEALDAAEREAGQ